MSAHVAASSDRARPGKRADGRARATVRVHGAATALKPVASQRIDLPHRDQLEERFGRPLDALRVYSGAEVRETLAGMGAVAATRGHDLFLAEPSAPLPVVAHEVAHALQATRTGTPANPPSAIEPANSGAEREARAVAELAAGQSSLTAPVSISEGLYPETLALLRMTPGPGGVETPSIEVEKSAPVPTPAATVALPSSASGGGKPESAVSPGATESAPAGDAFQLPPTPELTVSAEDVAARESALAEAEAVIAAASTATEVMAAFAAAPPTLKAQHAGSLEANVAAASSTESTEWQADVPELKAELAGSEPPAEAIPVLAPPGDPVVLEEGAIAPAPEPQITDVPDPGPFVASEDVTHAFAFLVEPDPAAFARGIGDSLSEVPTSDQDVPRSPGPAPEIPLGGETDPGRIAATEKAGSEQATKARAGAAGGVIEGTGPERVQPREMTEAYQVGELPAPVITGAPVIEGPESYTAMALPPEVQVAFDEQQQGQMQASLAQATNQAATATTERDVAKETAVGEAEAGVAKLNETADGKQREAVISSRTEIQAARQGTLDAQQAEVERVEGNAANQRRIDQERINGRVTEDKTKIDNEYATAEGQVAEKVAEGERKAAAEKAAAERKAEDQSWWDRAVSFVKDAFNALIDAIGKIFDGIRSAVNLILDKVKAAALALIDGVAIFIKGAIAVFGQILKAAVDGLIGKIFPELAARLNAAIDGAVASAQAAVDVVADGLKAGVSALVEGLRKGLNAALNAFQAGIMLAVSLAAAAITGDWGALARRVLEAVLRVVGVEPESFYAFVGRAEETFTIIIANPLGFLGNIVSAVSGGFQRFADNIVTHLQAGVIGWLTGTLGSAGITLPTAFDLMGVLDLARQVLGLTWDLLKAKARKLVGEANVERLQAVFGFIETLITEGWGGLWNKIMDGVATIRDLVFDGIKSFILERVVIAAITKLASLFNPVGAIVQLVITAWNLYTFLRDQLSRIVQVVQVVQSVTDAIGDIAREVLEGAILKVESVLGSPLPLALDLLARLLGLGNVGAKVKEVVEQVRAMVERAIDTLLQKALAMFKGDGKAKGDAGKTDEAPGGVVREGQRTFALPLDFEGEHHTVTAVVRGNHVGATIASARRGQLRDVIRAAIKELDKRRVPRAERDRHEALKQRLWDFNKEVDEEELSFEWKARGKPGTFQVFVEARINELLTIMRNDFATAGIASLDAIFAPAFAGTRFMPSETQGSKWIRPNLYEQLRAWGTFRDKIVVAERREIAGKATDAHTNVDFALWSELNTAHQLPESAAITSFTGPDVYATNYELDHHISVSQHWNSLGGHNTDDDGRTKFYFNEDNLRVVTEEYNRKKGGEKVVPVVEGDFRAAVAEAGARGAKTIQTGGSELRFLGADGKEIP